MAFKAKLLVVGPPESGKTYISNLLAEATESSRTIYRPTHGVRILEFGTQGQSDGETVLVDVELWDCAGKQEFENCWPAFAKDTKGVILVYDPNVSSTTRGIEKWYKYFIKKQGLKDSQCILLAVHKVDVQNSPKSWRAPPGLQSVRCVHTNIDDDQSSVREFFTGFVMELVSLLREKRDKEELGIVAKKKR